MKSYQDYKNLALANLEGKWSKAIIATIISFFLAECVGSILSEFAGDDTNLGLGIQGLWEMVCLPLGWGFSVYFLNLIRNEDIQYGRLFDGYRDFKRVFLAELLTVIAVGCGLVLLIVPGIVVALMLSQTEFILKDDSEISAVDAMAKSIRMMDGHKAELLWLMLSFIGWFLLCLLTLGIGFIFLTPYWNTTLAHYYEDLKAEEAA